MYCPNCGTKNEPGSKFCSNCGTLLDFKNEKIEQPNQAVEQPKNRIANSQEQPAETVEPKTEEPNESVETSEVPVVQPKKRSKTWIWILVGIVLVTAAGGWFYYQHSQSQSQGITNSPINKKVNSKFSSSSNVSKPALAFPKDKVNDDIKSALSGVKGDNSVYVSPTSSNDEVVKNNGPQRAASNIKVFIMIVAYQKVADGKLSLDDQYTLKDSDKVGGTGDTRKLSDGTEVSIQRLIDYMMEDSDNTAANIMIRKLGGLKVLNSEIKKLGTKDTKLERMLMDTKALSAGKDNYTSVNDLGMVYKKIYNHKMVSTQYDSAMLDILKQNKNHTKLPESIPSEATIYNKTGEFDDYGVENDAAIFENDKGAVVVIVLSQKGDRDEQVSAMNDLGSSIYQDVLE